jgi:hypothetical protein
MRRDKKPIGLCRVVVVRMWVKIYCHRWAIAECMDVVVLSFDTFSFGRCEASGVKPYLRLLSSLPPPVWFVSLRAQT